MNPPADASNPVLMKSSRFALPKIITRPIEVTSVANRFASVAEPIACDAERASGFRYGQKTCLLQIRSESFGTELIDTLAAPDLSLLSEPLSEHEWVIHAAVQDLPSLRDLNFSPKYLFDTEVAGRMLGLEHVNLGSMVEEFLHIKLTKAYSAVDWSTRPLPKEWLQYAVLDVELLIPLRRELIKALETQGKLQWAQAEFQAALDTPTPPQRPDPWRRVSGIGAVRSRVGMAIIRELWLVRERIAQNRDLPPGRVLTDSALVAAAQQMPRTVGALSRLHHFGAPSQTRLLATWHRAIETALATPKDELPELRPPQHRSTPPVRAWKDRKPQAHEMLLLAREVISEVAEELVIQPETLLTPDHLRRLCWELGRRPQAQDIAELLRSFGARDWQIQIVAEELAEEFSYLEC